MNADRIPDFAIDVSRGIEIELSTEAVNMLSPRGF